jgi:hypothetical protein
MTNDFSSGKYFVDPLPGAFEPFEVECKFHSDYAETCVKNANKVDFVELLWLHCPHFYGFFSNFIIICVNISTLITLTILNGLVHLSI